MIVGSGAAERFHLRWFAEHLLNRGVAVRPISTERPGFALAGPKLRRAAGGPQQRGRLAAALPSSPTAAWISAAHPHWSRVSRSPASSVLTSCRRRRPSWRPTTHWSRPGGNLAPVDLRRPRAESLGGQKSFGAWLRDTRRLHAAAGRPRPLHRFREEGDFIGRDAAFRQRNEKDPSSRHPGGRRRRC